MDHYGHPYVSLTVFRTKVDTERQALTTHPIMIPDTNMVLLTRKAQATITTDREYMEATAIKSSQVVVTVVASVNAVLRLCVAAA